MRLAHLLLVASMLFATGAGAQESGKAHRIGLLSISSAKAGAPARVALLGPLAELGYREGRNLTLEERYADGDMARLSTLANELVRADDIIR